MPTQEGHVEVNTEVGATSLPAKEHQRCQQTPEAGRGGNTVPLTPPGHPDLPTS